MDNNGVTAEESAMDIDIPGESNGSTAGDKENGLVLYPVEQYGSGEGLPYAPVDWPNPGDCWRWKVGKRMSISGHYIDRYLYVPDRLHETKRKRRSFASKLSVAQYIQEKYPGSDVQAFFATFSWKIPGKKSAEGLGSGAGSPIFIVSSEERSEHLGSDSQSGGVGCKAGNEACPSLEEIGNSSSNVMMPCDVCCSEPRFCRECCCILCCKTVSYSYGSYSFIKCEAVVEDNYMCGHIAHVDCALRTYMAGTVGGSIGLDAEYYCRRCDARTDLVPHVTRLLKTCESISSRTNVENILNVGFRVLRNSEKSSAKRLFRRIGFAMEKLKTGASLDEIWRAEDVPTVTTGLFQNGEDTPEVSKHQELLELESLKLDAEIAQVLRALKKAQESEYKIAEERLLAQKDYIMHLHEQLDKDRSEISQRSSSNQDELFEAIMDRLDRVKMETQRLRDMKEVAKGFGKTSKDILKDYFDLETDS